MRPASDSATGPASDGDGRRDRQPPGPRRCRASCSAPTAGRSGTRGVSLLVDGRSVAVGTTDADGRFRLEAAPGRYDVRFSAGRDGVLWMDGVVVDGRGLEGTFRLSPAARLDVVVTSDGRAASGLPVVVSATDDVGARVLAAAETDGRGAATFPELAAATSSSRSPTDRAPRFGAGSPSTGAPSSPSRSRTPPR